MLLSGLGKIVPHQAGRELADRVSPRLTRVLARLRHGRVTALACPSWLRVSEGSWLLGDSFSSGRSRAGRSSLTSAHSGSRTTSSRASHSPCLSVVAGCEASPAVLAHQGEAGVRARARPAGMRSAGTSILGESETNGVLSETKARRGTRPVGAPSTPAPRVPARPSVDKSLASESTDFAFGCTLELAKRAAIRRVLEQLAPAFVRKAHCVGNLDRARLVLEIGVQLFLYRGGVLGAGSLLLLESRVLLLELVDTYSSWSSPPVLVKRAACGD